MDRLSIVSAAFAEMHSTFANLEGAFDQLGQIRAKLVRLRRKLQDTSDHAPRKRMDIRFNRLQVKWGEHHRAFQDACRAHSLALKTFVNAMDEALNLRVKMEGRIEEKDRMKRMKL